MLLLLQQLLSLAPVLAILLGPASDCCCLWFVCSIVHDSLALLGPQTRTNTLPSNVLKRSLCWHSHSLRITTRLMPFHSLPLVPCPALPCLQTWLWPNAPKPLSALVYVIMGWSALPYMHIFIESLGSQVVLLVTAGGVLYSIGAFVYATRWPDPFPEWFGFHEVFHTLVILATICHFTGMYQVVVKGNFVGPVLH